MIKPKNIRTPYLKSPEDFSFRRSNTANLFLKKTFTNTIITLTDKDYRVIACHSSGSSGITHTSRRKKAPHAVALIVKKLYPHFLSRKIRFVELIITRKVSQHIHYLARELFYYGITIVALHRRRICAHNGVRRKKLPRK